MKTKLTPDTHVLYLDFDTVLHPGEVFRTMKRGIHLRGRPGHKLFESAPILTALLDPHPDVRIILSTSWVRTVGFNESKERLPMELQRRVAGATWHSEMRQDEWKALTRYQQIQAHATRHELTRWIAIDDDDMGWPDVARDRLVRCHGDLGLSNPKTQQELAEKLKLLKYGKG